MRLLLTTLLVALVPQFALATQATPLRAAKIIECSAGTGYSTTWPASGLRTTSDTMPSRFRIKQIDAKKGIAQLEGAHGEAKVFVHLGDALITAFELLPSGGVSTTTVYRLAGQAQPTYVYAESRHNTLVDAAIVGQYYGTCSVTF